MNRNSVRASGEAPDAAVREQATDPKCSFIVQAPAGSGKTEVLTRRMLRALAAVDRPESVLAITFTRKAASEMRNRILSALAESRRPEEPGLPEHKRELRRLAQAVSQHDARLGWRLLDNPQRLQVRTIDSFCESVQGYLPMLSGIGGEIAVSEDAAPLYRAAADRTIALLVESARPRESEAVAVLLRYLDNNVSKLRTMLGQILQKRDQWLELFGRSNAHTEVELVELRDKLHRALDHAVSDELDAIRDEILEFLGHPALDQLLRFARIAGDVAEADSVGAKLRDLSDLPRPGCDELPRWRALSNFCLTGGGTLRAQFTARNGGLAGPDAKECTKFFKETLAALPGIERVCVLLSYVREKLPDPAYSAHEWEFVRALLITLPVTVANLRIEEAEQGRVDFVEVAMAASAALQSPEGPTDLGLAMGARIRHVLVDEFQDTSVSQVKLLRSLAQTWESDEDCSIFAVGDPMQSIYAFRNAEVANFTNAVRDEQVAEVHAESLRLSTNFRSQAGLVEWFNSVFPTIFGGLDAAHKDELLGEVEYSVAIPWDETSGNEAVCIHGFAARDYESEADCVAKLAKHAVEEAASRGSETSQSVAILVRARSHLFHIVKALKDHDVQFRAVEIDGLGERQTVLDLEAISRALLNRADRTAWLAILRAPWCGLTLADLWELCRDKPNDGIFDLLRARVGSLSRDGQRRAGRVLAIMESALADAGRVPLSLRVERAWTALGGIASLRAELKDACMSEAHAFFRLLREAEDESLWPGTEAFSERLSELFAPADTSAGIRLDVMTIHKAKGLEWDTVIVPALGRRPRQEQKELLYWRQRLRGEESDLLLAPMRPPGDDEGVSVESYLRDLLRRRSTEESKRLLYVAATRARRRLHLTATLPNAGKQPSSNSLLSFLWRDEGVRSQFLQTEAPPPDPVLAESAETAPAIRRLPVDWKLPAPPPPLQWDRASAAAVEAAPLHTYEWASDARRITGTVTHAFLQQIAREGLEHWNDARLKSAPGSVRASLRSAGIAESDLETSASDVLRALRNTINHERGRWILSAHPEARSESAITANLEDGMRNIRIDRTFVENETRWIIDFKITTIEGGSPESYLDSQVAKYKPDLNRYRTAMQLLDPRPVKCGLYFPLLQAWREVES
jgi:ATP-dependent helicase/nuclease subunit A